MRKYKILLIVLLAGLMSCSKFLDVTPKNVISMDDMPSIKKSLAGFLYNVTKNSGGFNGNSLPYSPLGKIEFNFLGYTEEWDLAKYANTEMTESKIKFVNWKEEGTAGAWNLYYSAIGFMNLILFESAKVEGEQEMRDYVMGEAYAFRAYCFFKLVQYYSPYKDNALGVPICLESYEDFEKLTFARSTQKEVYAQVISDITEALQLLERTASRQSYNILYQESVLNRMMAEVYHYKALSAAAETDDWKNAALWAAKETEGRTLESDPTMLKKIFDSDLVTLNDDPECAARIQSPGSGFYTPFNQSYASNEFYLTYLNNNNDVRKSFYYKGSYTPDVYTLTVDKFNSNGPLAPYGWSNYVYCGFRLAEAFLIQAEALAMSDKLPEAKAIFTRFKEARYTGAITVPAEKEALLQDIYRERKIEFFAEGDYSWLDMKRLGATAEHTVDGITYKLEKDDWRYTFPIPSGEIEHNKYIRQNPGWILN